MLSVSRTGPEVPLSEIGDPDPAVESGNMTGFASFRIGLNDDDVALYELVYLWVLYFEFAKSKSSQNRAIVLGMSRLVPDDATASLQGEPNVHCTFALTMFLGILAQMLCEFFRVEPHAGP
jgi:hypothetical protein